MKKIILLLLTIPVISFAQDKRNYFIHLSSDPMINPSAAIMSVHAANEALKQGHKVIYFVAGDGVRILINDVINNLHTVTPHGGGFGKISQMAKKKLLEFSNNGGVIHVSEGSFNTFGINQNNYSNHLIEVKNINWSYPKELIQESSKADIVFSY
jgi:predicted peroxiredoxin